MTRHLRIVHDGPGWAYWHRARALERHAPRGWRVTLADEYGESELGASGLGDSEAWSSQPKESGAGESEAGPPALGGSRRGSGRGDLGLGGGPFDLVLALNYLHVERFRERLDALGSAAPLVTSYNTGWPRRRRALERCLAVADATVFVNRQSWEAAGRPPRSVQISNGVDRSVFAPRQPLDARPPRAIWIGGAYHRELKGFDDYLLPAAERLAELGIECDLRLVEPEAERRSPEALAAWYNGARVYLNASEVEGTPNPVLEAAACGVVPVSTSVGNLPELVTNGVDGFLVDRSVEALVTAAVEACHHHAEFARRLPAALEGWDWPRRTRDYYRLFNRLVD